MRLLIAGLALVVLAGIARAGDVQDSSALRARVEALRVEDVAWRTIPWKSCLLEGLALARSEDKPALLWVFIDRPVDDARC